MAFILGVKFHPTDPFPSNFGTSKVSRALHFAAASKKAYQLEWVLGGFLEFFFVAQITGENAKKNRWNYKLEPLPPWPNETVGYC